jgi:hypothetical protein
MYPWMNSPWMYPPFQDDPKEIRKKWKEFLKENDLEEKKHKYKVPHFTIFELCLILMVFSPFVAPIQRLLLESIWKNILIH